MKHFRVFFFLGIAAMVSACNSTDDKAVDTGLKYFPLTVGSFWIYDVSEVTFDTLAQNKIETYQEKYEVAEGYENELKETVFVMHVSKRNTDNDPWNYAQTWSAKVSLLNEIIVSEENIPYIKLLIPVKEGLTWKGNKYNTIESDRNNGRVDEFSINDFKEPFENFTTTITVYESDDLNFVYKDVRYSVYAEDIGLVYRKNNYVEYCDDIDCFGLYLRKHERTKIQTLKEYVNQ